MADAPPDRMIQFVSKLVRLSQERRYRWEAIAFESSEKRRTGFATCIDGRKLRIFKREFTVMVNQPNPFSKPTTRTKHEIVLEMINEDDVVLYTFRDIAGLGDLFESASLSAAGVDEFIDAILNKT